MKIHFFSLTVGKIYIYLLLITLASCGTYAYITLYDSKADLEVRYEALAKELTKQKDTNDYLSNTLEQDQVARYSLQDQVANIQTQVNALEKLKSLDTELLQKYSKVFFLNENYKPKSLTEIANDFTFDPKKILQIETDVWPHLRDLLNGAKGEDLNLKIISAYRSFGTQASLKSTYKVTYGAGTANAFSADQGYSEHQLGTAVDFTTTKTGSTFKGFDKTPEYAWLQNNAYRFGFILSYPQGNKYYVYEPWHWRYVGKALATYMHDNNKNFYDLDQRFIDKYLLGIFD